MEASSSSDPQSTPLNQLPQNNQPTNPQMPPQQPPTNPDVVESILQNAEHMNNPQLTPEQYMQNIQEMEYMNYPSSVQNEMWDEAKLPLFVAALVFLSQYSTVSQLFVKHLPKMFRSEGSLTMGGQMVKALAFGAVFYLVLRYVF